MVHDHIHVALKIELRFFGRDYESDEITSLILGHKLSLVYAQSGAGKTSIFNAQIVPLLEEYGHEVLPTGTLAVSLLSDDQSNYNADANKSSYTLSLLQSLEPKGPPLADWTLSDFLKKFSSERDSSRNFSQLVLVIDQLEELFKIHTANEKTNRLRFFEGLADALNNNPSLRIVLLIREEYLASLDPYRDILPEGLRPHFRLELLNTDSALIAIKGPLQRLDISRANLQREIQEIAYDLSKVKVQMFDDKIYEVEGEYVEPIQLQVVCQRWWKDTVSSDGLVEDSARVPISIEYALEDFYVNIVLEVSRETGVSEEDIREWCEEYLITSTGTRSMVHSGMGKTPMTNQLLPMLEKRNLIKREFRAGAAWYELTHDRLIEPILNANRRFYRKGYRFKQIKEFFERKQ